MTDRSAGGSVAVPAEAEDSPSTRARYGRLTEQARSIGADPKTAVARLPELLEGVPFPGEGDTTGYLSTLAALGAGDLTVARVVEPHLDAAAILHQAGLDDLLTGGSAWGVFAAEGPGARLQATEGADGWTLTGTKPWCSLAGVLDHAVITAHTGPDTRRAFAVSLREPGVRVAGIDWAARGLAAVPSGPVEFDHVPATPVGDDGWYLRRPGFAWGGIGVAAVWYGGARALAAALTEAARSRTPDQIALMHLGASDIALHQARCVLDDAARVIDSGEATGAEGAVLAARVRGVCAATVDTVLTTVGHGLGPAPLTFDEEHARRVADLTVYVRQHHAERDLARLGETTLEEAG